MMGEQLDDEVGLRLLLTKDNLIFFFPRVA